jgi:hypothetical protein
MTLRNDFLAQLQSIIGKSSQLVVVSDGPRSVRGAIDQCEALAVATSEFLLETSELAGVDVAQLESASRSLCGRVNYLLEPIAPIETDADSCTVQMRSNPPLAGDTSTVYYELMLRRGGSIELARYEKQPAAPRVRVAATLTHEVIGRLIEDFDATVEEIIAP